MTGSRSAQSLLLSSPSAPRLGLSRRFLKFRPKWRISSHGYALVSRGPFEHGSTNGQAFTPRVSSSARPARKTLSPAEPSGAAAWTERGRLEFELDFFALRAAAAAAAQRIQADREPTRPIAALPALPSPAQPCPAQRAVALAYRSLAKSGALPSPSSQSTGSAYVSFSLSSLHRHLDHRHHQRYRISSDQLRGQPIPPPSGTLKRRSILAPPTGSHSSVSTHAHPASSIAVAVCVRTCKISTQGLGRIGTPGALLLGAIYLRNRSL